jgi:hypothetical protein
MNDNYLQGLFPTMSNAEYHGSPGIGSSGFKLLERSPAHFYAAYIDPERERSEPTPLMKIGTAWHAAVFEPAKFDDEYVQVPDGLDRRTKEGKALWAELEASGKEPLTADGWHQIEGMAKAAHAHPVTQVIMAQHGGMAEASFFWVDAETGAPCRIRPDYAVPPCKMFANGLIIDGKSNDDSSAEGFAKNCWNSEMYYQAAFYSDGMQQHWKTPEPPAFMWLSQERDRPYATAYYAAGADIVAYGRKQYRRLLRVYAECLRTGVWPSYPQVVQPLELPTWAAKQVSDEVAA